MPTTIPITLSVSLGEDGSNMQAHGNITINTNNIVHNTTVQDKKAEMYKEMLQEYNSDSSLLYAMLACDELKSALSKLPPPPRDSTTKKRENAVLYTVLQQTISNLVRVVWVNGCLPVLPSILNFVLILATIIVGACHIPIVNKAWTVCQRMEKNSLYKINVIRSQSVFCQPRGPRPIILIKQDDFEAPLSSTPNLISMRYYDGLLSLWLGRLSLEMTLYASYITEHDFLERDELANIVYDIHRGTEKAIQVMHNFYGFVGETRSLIFYRMHDIDAQLAALQNVRVSYIQYYILHPLGFNGIESRVSQAQLKEWISFFTDLTQYTYDISVPGTSAAKHLQGLGEDLTPVIARRSASVVTFYSTAKRRSGSSTKTAIRFSLSMRTYLQ